MLPKRKCEKCGTEYHSAIDKCDAWGCTGRVLLVETEQPEIEIWVCGHTKKCGWSGPQSELKYIEVESAPLKVSKGSCPKCGQVKTGFYVRKVKPSNGLPEPSGQETHKQP